MATPRPGAGGKIVTNRRKQRLSATPYDRPPPPPPPPPPPLPSPPPKSPNWFRFLASGAGKILNYIFTESESSSSEEEDSASEDDNDIDNENLYEMPFNEVDTLNEENLQNSKTKWTIEQLIMQARFSREESDKLKKVLDSRVSEAGEKNFLAGSPENADMYNKAVQEAKRWFQEKKVGSSSVAGLAHGTCNLNSTGLGHVDTEGGSPVDVARSYMKERPPWSSPTRSFELRTPLTTTMKLFKERTLDSVSSKNVQKSNSLVSGSWNIQEELRRVRSKATEDMLRNSPAKIDPSLFQVGSNRVESFRAAFQPVISVSRNNEDSEAVLVEGEIDNAKLLHSSISNHADEHYTGPSLGDINGVPVTKVTENFDEKQNVNGFSSSQTSLSAGQHDEENHSMHKANDKELANNVDGNCELLSEAYMEVPIVTENTMGMQYEELAIGMAQPSSDEKAEIVAGKQQQTRKLGRNSRRGRGRGK